MRRSKAIITASIAAIVAAILLIPAANRNLLWLVALLICIQNDVSLFLENLPVLKRRRLRRRISSPTQAIDPLPPED